MKILYAIHSCIMGGATISFFNLVRNIVKEDNEVVVVYPIEKDSFIVEKLNEIGCKCIGVKWVPATWYTYSTLKSKIKLPLSLLKLFIKKIYFYNVLKCIIKKQAPDIIHTNTGVIHESAKIAEKLAIPHIWHLREYQLKDFGMHPLPTMKKYKNLLKKSYTICITKDIQKYFNLNNSIYSRVIYDPTISEKLIHKEFEKQSGKPFFLIANRLSKEKGVDEAIRAFSFFHKNHENYNLKICGFGNESYIDELKNLCRALGIENYVDFLGYADTSLIYSLMKSSKGLIVASYNEGFGRMTAEANMLGIPVIGRDTAGTKEILDQTYGGVKFESLNSFVEGLNRLADMHEEEVQEMMAEPQKISINLFISKFVLYFLL